MQDLVEWAEDEDEYLRKNLPSDMVCDDSLPNLCLVQ